MKETDNLEKLGLIPHSRILSTNRDIAFKVCISKIFCSDNKNKTGKMIAFDAKLVISFFLS